MLEFYLYMKIKDNKLRNLHEALNFLDTNNDIKEVLNKFSQDYFKEKNNGSLKFRAITTMSLTILFVTAIFQTIENEKTRIANQLDQDNTELMKSFGLDVADQLSSEDQIVGAFTYVKDILSDSEYANYLKEKYPEKTISIGTALRSDYLELYSIPNEFFKDVPEETEIED